MILVTGGAGFIGSVVLWELNNRGYTDLVCVDRWDQRPKWKNIRKRQLLDLLSPEEVFDFIGRYHQEISVIVHLGACSSTVEQDLHYLIQNNLRYSQKLFSLASQWQIPFYYASSAATYGGGEEGYKDQESLLHRLKPLNPYGLSKQWFDLWILAQKPINLSSWAGLKFFNVYGPGEYHKGDMRSIILKTFEQLKAQNGGPVRLFRSYRPEYKDGEQKRDFIYVKDVARVIGDLVEKKPKDLGGIYNLGSGQARSFLDVGKSVSSAMNMAFEVQWISMPDHLKTQYQYFTQGSMARFHLEIPSALPSFSLEAGVEDYVRRYLRTEDPYL